MATIPISTYKYSVGYAIVGCLSLPHHDTVQGSIMSIVDHALIDAFIYLKKYFKQKSQQ